MFLHRDLFESNRASQGSGGGVYMNGLSELTCSSCLIQNNTAYSDGGGLYTVSWKMSFSNGSKFLNNIALNGDGGGVYCHNWFGRGNITFSYSLFEGNHACYNDYTLVEKTFSIVDFKDKGKMTKSWR